MSYVISKHPSVRINLMVKKENLAELVSYVERCGCRYKKEREIVPGNGETWVSLVDIEAENGKALGDLIGLFYSMEWKNLTEGREEKYYMIIAERKGKKYAGKMGPKAGKRSKGGNKGKSNASDRYNVDRGYSGDDSEPGDPGDYDIRIGKEDAPAGDGDR